MARKELSDEEWRQMLSHPDADTLTEEEITHLPSFSPPRQGGRSPGHRPQKNFISRFLDRDRGRKKTYAQPLTRADDHPRIPTKLGSALELEYQARSPNPANQAKKTKSGRKQKKKNKVSSMAGLEPPAPRFGGTRSVTRRAAQEQQKTIHEKLQKAGMPIPRYEMIDLIGKGSYGKVYLAKDIDNSRLAAIKVIDADIVDYTDAPHNMREQTMRDFQHEVNVLSALKEYKVPNVNTIYDVFVVHDQLWIVTEFCAGGSVHTLMHAQAGKLQEKYVIAIIREVVKGLAKIHEASIIHRDIKAANIMITETGSVQIIDFGVAATIEPWANKRGTFIGTPNWMAPEFYKMTQAELQYGQEVDIWAVGCTVYEMVTGSPPNSKKGPNKRLIGHELSRNPPRLTPSEHVSQELCAFAEYLLQADPKMRPKARDILEHPYIKGTEKTHPTTILVDLVIDFNRWENEGGARFSLLLPTGPEPVPQAATDEGHDLSKDTDWRFSMVSTGSLDWEEQFATSEDANFSAQTARNIQSQRAPNIQVDSASDDSSFYSETYNMSGEATESGAEATYKPASEAPYGKEGVRGKSPAPKALVDPRAAQRGGNQLASIFNESKRPYLYGRDSSDDSSGPSSTNRSQSDLPLRNIASSSDVRQKEIFAPDPSQPRPLASSGIPNISSVNMGTIKQNRMLNKAGGGLQSDSSGDERSDHFGRQQDRQKRATMAWEPEWNVAASTEEPALPDPFGQPVPGGITPYNPTNLAPPGALQRPALLTANTAPGQIPTAPQLNHASRQSTASMLDMDALMAEDMPSSLESSFHFPQPQNEPQHPTAEAPGSPDAYDMGPITTETNHQGVEQDGFGVHQGLESATPLSGSPVQDERYPLHPEEAGFTRNARTNTLPRRRNRRRRLQPPVPPSQAVMSGTASEEEQISELTRLLTQTFQAIGDLQDDMEARLEWEERQYAESMDNSYQEEYEGEEES